jgi:hypothetical protein
MLIILFDSQGLVHKKFVPEGKMVNPESYKGVTDRLWKCTQQVCPDAFCSRLFLLHNYAHPPQSCKCLPIFYIKKMLQMLLYSPGLSLPDYFLFPKLKMKLKGLNFVNVAEIQEAITDELNMVQKVEFSAAFQTL